MIRLMAKLTTFFIAVLFTLAASASVYVNLSNTISGAINVNLSTDSDNNDSNDLNESTSYFTTFSRFGTGFSLFFTSFVYFSNFNTQTNSVGSIDLIPSKNPMDLEHQTPSMFMPFLAFSSVLGTSLFNYKGGTQNDLIGIMPIIPIQPESSIFRTSNNVSFDYGFFLYFSKDF